MKRAYDPQPICIGHGSRRHKPGCYLLSDHTGECKTLSQSALFPNDQKHDPGGKVSIAVPASWLRHAVFSLCEKYRYQLGRVWNDVPTPRLVLFVMMNPSTANSDFNDPTIAKCCRMARKWGYDGLLIGNVFAYRATDKRRMPPPAEALGPDNPHHLIEMAKRSEKVILAYGQLPTPYDAFAIGTAFYLRAMGFDLHALEISKDGITPKHPLYLKEDREPVFWKKSLLFKDSNK